MENLDRFYPVHAQYFDTALAEIRDGRKESHWMWYIFPQLRGLGYSHAAQYYGLTGLDEARRFSEDPVLGENLRTITRALRAQPVRNAFSIFGGTDAMKLRSCMTLFALADPDCGLYTKVLEEFFGGKRDQKTMELLR